MAFESPIVDWALGHKDTLSLNITRFTETEKWMPDTYDFRVSINYLGQSFQGEGLASDPVKATEKAITEVVERAICWELGFESNGVACHPNKEIAEDNAKKELVERDIFLRHFYSQTPGSTFTPNFILQSDIEKRLKNQGVSVEFFELRPNGRYKICLCLCVKLNSSSSILGLGCSEDLETSSWQAYGEALKNTLLVIGNDESCHPLSLNDFEKSNDANRDRFQLYLHNDMSASLDFLRKRSFSCEIEPTSFSDFIVEDLIPSDSVLKTAPVNTVRASHPSMLTPCDHVPQVIREKLALNNKYDNSKDLNPFPHPVG